MAQGPFQEIAADVHETKERLGRVEVDVRETKEHVGRLEDRVGRLELHAPRAEADVAQVPQTLIRHDSRFDSMDLRFDSIDLRFDSMEAALQKMNATILGAVNLVLERLIRGAHEERIGSLERAVFGAKT